MTTFTEWSCMPPTAWEKARPERLPYWCKDCCCLLCEVVALLFGSPSLSFRLDPNSETRLLRELRLARSESSLALTGLSGGVRGGVANVCSRGSTGLVHCSISKGFSACGIMRQDAQYHTSNKANHCYRYCPREIAVRHCAAAQWKMCRSE